MEGLIVYLILGCSALLLAIGGFYLRDKVATNRQFKPLSIKEGEDLLNKLMKKRHGAHRDYVRRFYDDFIIDFPEFSEEYYSYNYIRQCLSPGSDKKNPDLIEKALLHFEKVLIVEGSINFKKHKQ